MKKKTGDIIATLISFPFTLFSGAVGVVALILIRELVLKLVRLAGISHWSWKTIDDFSVIALAVIWLIFMVFCQYRYIKPTWRGRWRTLLVITGSQILVLVPVQVGNELSDQVPMAAATVLFLGAQAVVALTFMLLSRLPVFRAKAADESPPADESRSQDG